MRHGAKKTSSQAELTDGARRLRAIGSQRPLWFVLVYNNLVRHRKLMMLCHFLAVSENEAIGLLVRLWCECGERAQDGDLSHYTPAQIAATCGWPLKQARRLREALVEAGFLDRERGRLRVHDWEAYTGRAVLTRQANAKRVADFRRRRRARNANVTITPTLRNGHVRPKSRVDKSRVEKSRDRVESETSKDSTPTPIFSHPPEQRQGQGEDQDKNQNGRQALDRLYHEITGLPVDAGAHRYLAKLALKYGPSEVSDVLAAQGADIAGADNGLQYLGGILETRRREGRPQVGMAPPPPAPKGPALKHVPCAGGCGNVTFEVPADHRGPLMCEKCAGGGR
jgi:hypothetical protein